MVVVHPAFPLLTFDDIVTPTSSDDERQAMQSSAKQLRYLSAVAILRGEESVVGRSDYSTILIAHPSVSRLHATITLHDGRTYIQDLGSKNGTFVNGDRIGKDAVPIDIGDRVRIGHVECVVESTADNARETTTGDADGFLDDTFASTPEWERQSHDD